MGNNYHRMRKRKTLTSYCEKTIELGLSFHPEEKVFPLGC